MDDQSPELNDEQGAEKRADLALKKIQALCAGNGPEPARDVKLISYSEEIINFKAETFFQPDIEMAESVTPGAPPGGTKTGSQSEVKSLAHKNAEETMKDSMLTESLCNRVMEREDCGFFWDRQRVPLDAPTAYYHYEEPCSACRGQKFLLCRNCHGKGRATCLDCKGQRQKTCPGCRGARKINSSNGQENCRQCSGQGRVQCQRCMGKGESSCPKCASKGKMECHQCRGAGVINHVTTVNYYAQSHFEYEEAKIPERAHKYVKQLKGRLIEQGHVYAEMSDDSQNHKKEQSSAILTISYDTYLPFGDLKFMVGSQEFESHLFGYNANLVDMQPFLEQYMLSPLSSLNEAAEGNGNIALKVKSVMHGTRVGYDLIEGIVTKGAKHTAKLLQYKYGLGLEPEFIRNLVKAGKRALDKVTAKPRIMGLALGIGITTLFYVCYIFALAGLNGGPSLLRALADIIILLIGMALPYVVSQIFARQALLQALGDELKESLKLPKIGDKVYWGPVAAVVIFLMFCELAVRINPDAAPQLYSSFHAALFG